MSGERPPHSVELLRSCHQGDGAALTALVADNLDWIRGQVRRRLGQMLRRREDSQDIVQDALVTLLREGPKFLIGDQQQFRALMARLVENQIRREFDFHTAGRRDLRREVVPGDSATVITLDGTAAATGTPSVAATEAEARATMALALELLDPDDRLVILRREYQGQSFAAIAQEFGSTEDAARMRLTRALPKLAQKVMQLRQGQVTRALDEPPAPA